MAWRPRGARVGKKTFLVFFIFWKFCVLFHGRSAFNGAHSFIAWSWESVSLFWYSPQQTHSSESQTSQTDTKLNMLVTWVSHSALFHDGLKVVILCKIYKRKHSKEHCQRHNRPKALSTLTHSTILFQIRSLNKHWNLGQTSVWFCSKEQEIHNTTLTNSCNVTT